MCNSQYPQMQWPVNDEPLNTFGTLELLFPISKKEFVLVLFQFPNTIVVTSCYVPMHHLNMILFRSNMNRLFVVFPHLACHCALFTYNILPSESPNGILFMKQYFQIKITTICNVYSIIAEAWKFRPVNVLQVQWHSRGDATDEEEYLWASGKLTQCVTCKVYWNVLVPCLRAQQKTMQSLI